MLETSVVSHRVEGVNVDHGEGHCEREQVKSSRRESGAPGEEGEQLKSPKRKTIRVEFEETQDYVREANDMDMDQEEVEKLVSYRARSAFHKRQCFVVTVSARRLSAFGS